MFNGVKSGVNTHLDSRIGSRMDAALDSPSVALVHSRIKLLLGQLRRVGSMGGQDLHPFSPVAYLSAYLLSDLPGSVNLLHLLPGMAAGHTDSGIRVGNPGNSDKSLLRRQL